jgi:hypothetical protein
MKSITLTVCQGIGDIFWVYQLFAPHVDAIRFRVLHCPGNDRRVASRATEFISSLAKVQSVTGLFATETDYRKVSHGRFSVEHVLRAGGGMYACNDLLENGVRLDACSPLPIEETVEIPMEPINLPVRFIAGYVAGGTLVPEQVRRVGVWSVDQWAVFLREFYARQTERLPLVLIGAEYDRSAAESLAARLDGLASIDLRIGLPIAQSSYVISRSDWFLGYQSGLNVIADQLNVRQLKMFFPCYPKMLYSWAKRSNIERGIYNAARFDQSPAEVAGFLIAQPDVS